VDCTQFFGRAEHIPSLGASAMVDLELMCMFLLALCQKFDTLLQVEMGITRIVNASNREYEVRVWFCGVAR
jgi:hypothetical protein